MRGFTSDRTFKSIFLSYAIVLVIPLIFGVLISTFIAKSVYQEIIEVGTYSARLTQSKVDNTLDSVLSVASNLAANETLRSTIFFDDESENDPSIKILINSMSKDLYSISNELIENIYIYYAVSESVISYDGRISGLNTSWYLNKELDLTGAELMNYVREHPSGGILMCNIQDNPILLAVCPIYGKNTYNVGGFVCIKINKYRLLTGIRYYEFGEGNIIITDGDNYIVSSGEHGIDYPIFADKFPNTLYTVNWDSRFEGIKYVLSIPTKSFFSSFNKAKLITVIYATICLVSGTAIVLFSSYKRYRLLKSFMKLTSTTTPYDAISSIEQTLKQSTQHKFRFGIYQTKINQLKREKMLESLFTYTPHPERVSSILEEYGIVFPYKYFTIAVIDVVMDYSNLFFGEGQDMNEEDLYMHTTTILRAVYEELFSVYAKAYITTISNSRVCIINFDNDNGQIEKTLRDAAEFCKSNFGMELLCCRGQTVASISHITESLKSALNEAHTISYGDIPYDENATAGKRIKDYIDKHYNEKNLDITMIADDLMLSPSYISRIFKRTRGHTILEYINLCRITEAKKLLRETNKSVREVSETVGYSSPRTFTRNMQRLEEMSPSEYRTFHNNKKKISHANDKQGVYSSD